MGSDAAAERPLWQYNAEHNDQHNQSENMFPSVRLLTTIQHVPFMKRTWREKNQQFATIGCLLLTSISTCFGHHCVHLQENKGPVTAFGILFWFCWMWLVAVVGRWTETFMVLTSCKTAPHNRYQPQPAEPEHTKCSNRAFVLLKMGIIMPETCWDRS